MSSLHLNIRFPWPHSDIIIEAPSYAAERPNRMIEQAIEKACGIMVKRKDPRVASESGSYVISVDAENTFSLSQVFECIGTGYDIVTVIPWNIPSKKKTGDIAPPCHGAHQSQFSQSPGDFWQ